MIRRLPLPSWLYVSAAILLVLGAGIMITLNYRRAVSLGCDFTNDYRAALALREGLSIYAATNDHPPLVALFVVPLTLLPYDTALFLWTLCTVVAYIAILLYVTHEFEIQLDWFHQLLLMASALAWYPFLAHASLGQISILLTICVTLGWHFMLRERDVLAGIMFGIACALKLFPGLIAVALLARRRWQALIAMGSAFLVGILVPTLMTSWQDLYTYIKVGMPLNAARWAAYPINNSITGTISRLLTEGLYVEPVRNAPELAMALIILLNTGSILILWLQISSLPDAREVDTLTICLTSVVMLLVSPITWQHSSVLLILPFGLLFKTAAQVQSERIRYLGLVAVGILALPDIEIAQRIMEAMAPYRMPWYYGIFLTGNFIALVLLWCLLWSIRDTSVSA